MSKEWIPYKGQLAFLKAKQRIRVLACGRRWGKSEAAARDIFLNALKNSLHRQMIIAPTRDQARLIFDRTEAMLEQHSVKYSLTNDPHPIIHLGAGFITARSASRNGKYLRGYGADQVIVDEAAYIPESVVYEVIMPMLAESSGRLALLSTPCGKNYFYKLFIRGREHDEEVWSYSAPTYEHGLVPRNFLTAQKRLLSKRQYKVEYQAKFLDNEQAVFQNSWILHAQSLDISHLLLGAPIAVGIDWARYHDFTAVVALKGTQEMSKIIRIDRFNQISWSEQVERASAMIKDLNANYVLCDRTSVGDPLLENLQHALPDIKVEGLHFTADSKRQLIDRLVLAFEQGRLQIDSNVDLLRELNHFESESLASGHVSLNAASGYHDDLVIALALALSALPSYSSGIGVLSKARNSVF